MKLNIEILRSFEPCYDPTRYFSEDWEGTLQDILKDDRIPSKDRIWVFSKAMPESKCREFARWCALQVIDLRDAPDVVREYLETGNEKIRSAARAAACPDAWAAARAAAWPDAWPDARAAARAAAGAAAGDAWEAQLAKAIELLNQ